MILGRPNVGKSTLFNRLVGTRKAVVSSIRGTTRDLITATVQWQGQTLTIVDTGGVELEARHGLPAAVQRHRDRALQQATHVLMICDAQQGLLPADEHLLAQVRRQNRPVTVVVNKADNRPLVPSEFFGLGAEAYAVSALHGQGITPLLDHLVKATGASADAVPTQTPVAAVAIVGRQNVGKSSLFNALLREERMLVSEVPGTTRDAVDTILMVERQPIRLVDTAGLRHRRKIRDPVDQFAMSRAIAAIRRCDVALLVLDAPVGVTRDDLRIVSHVRAAGCGLVIVANKWDLVAKADPRRLEGTVHQAAPSTRFAPVMAVSAKTGFNVTRSVALAWQVAQRLRQGLPLAECEALFRKAWNRQPPPRTRGRLVQLRAARWLPGRPATIELVVSPAAPLRASYEQYLLKQLATQPRLIGVPVRLVVAKPNGR